MSTRGSLCMLPALVLGLLLGAQTARAEDEDRDAFVKGTPRGCSGATSMQLRPR